MPIQFWGGASDTAVIVWDGVETISGSKTFTNIIKGDISSNGASYFTDICANNIYFTGDISGHDASFQNLTVNGVNITGSGGGGSAITVKNQNVALATAATTLDFVGAGVVASGTGAIKTITIAGGGGGGSSLWTAGSGNIIYYNTGTPQVAIGLTDPSAGAALHVNGKIFASDDVQAFYSSDRRFKDNIRAIENPLESLDKLNGYRFTWNEDLSHIHSYEGEDIGVIAQEVEEVFPEIVSNRTNGYKGVKYEKIVPLLIECIKELKSEIDILKSKIGEQSSP